MKEGALRFTWLGHASFKITSPGGKEILIDPWVFGNPACPDQEKKIDRLDLMLITHGHFDHIADAVELGKSFSPNVVSIYETSHWLQSKGVMNTLPMNKGGSQVVDGIKVTMVHADHSCGILDDGKIIYGGDPCGYVIEFENGVKIYHAGDTNVFGDMKIIAELYRPDLAFLPIGDLFTMSPREAAYACKLLNPKCVIPMHFGTFPLLTGNPEKFRKEMEQQKQIEIREVKPGEKVEGAALVRV